MDKKEKINRILTNIRFQIDELLENESTLDMTAEEVVNLATELATVSPIDESVTYTSPVGQVDLSQVTFVGPDEYPFFIGGGDHEDTDV